MSADNWAECPKCGEGNDVYRHSLPFREDYEIGVYDGKFKIYYRGRCECCGFCKSFNHTEPV